MSLTNRPCDQATRTAESADGQQADASAGEQFILQAARELIERAASLGVVLTIEQVPNKPLRMINASSVASVRLAREPAEQALWCVHVAGPDEVWPSSSWDAAQSMVVMLNDIMTRNPGVHDAVTDAGGAVAARVIKWPFTREAHAEFLAAQRSSGPVPGVAVDFGLVDEATSAGGSNA